MDPKKKSDKLECVLRAPPQNLYNTDPEKG